MGFASQPYLFIQYADAVAKIKPEKAERLLYRFSTVGSLGVNVNLYATGGKNKETVKLSKLNDRKTWNVKEEQMQRNIRNLVVNQMCAYIQRLQCTRPPYAPPKKEQMTAFADAFPFTLTPDQAVAIDDCYEDLSRDIPMDRLVVGDVGFGKTEVAIRAIFRVFAAGGQCFVMAPTTVLAKQHAANIAARLRPHGARVGLLNRNVKDAEKNDIIAGFTAGEVHVIVGTHMLLNLEATTYKKLNLLVVDEEQRFGVRHKDIIGALKSTVDVLTLSATPIPRTLHMVRRSIASFSATYGCTLLYFAQWCTVKIREANMTCTSTSTWVK